MLTHFGSNFETLHDVSASHLERNITWPRLLDEKPKRREEFKNVFIKCCNFELIFNAQHLLIQLDNIVIYLSRFN